MARKHKSSIAKSGKKLLPGRDEILAYVAENPTRTSKRDIARAFKISGDRRKPFKALLRQLQQDGLLQKSRRGFTTPGELPPVTVLNIITRDRDGGLLAKPAQWSPNEGGLEEEAPLVSIRRDSGKRRSTNRRKVAGVGDRVLARIERTGPKGIQYSAHVIKILDSPKDAVLGVYRSHQDGSRTGGGWIEPVERRQREMEINADDDGDATYGDLVEVQSTRAGRHGRQQGRIIRVIGRMDSEKAVSMIAIHANDIPHIFPDQVIDEAKKARAAEIDGRQDWRERPLITIDPADAKDHDDAIYAVEDDSRENPGGFRVTVAIADVSFYVRPGSTLDQEALKRGNSVYFPDRVVPMLPEVISNDLCSLKENEDRPAIAVEMVFSSAGKKLSHRFHRIMMRSRAKLAYVQAQAAIDNAVDEKTAPLLEPVLTPLWAAYNCLLKGRSERAPLDLDLPERKIILKKDGTVARVEVPPRLDAHKLVEEFMIQANVAAAETLERRRHALIYRIHDAPSLAKLESLREFLKTLGLSLVKGGSLRPHHFNQILNKVEGKDSQELVNQVVLRSQSQAEYSPQNIGHFGLNLQRYAHFTSPIRRYADLIVHRALVSALALGEGGLTRQEEAGLDEVAAAISETERRAMKAERQTIDRLIAAHMASHINAQFAARINGVTRAGLFVTLEETGADGFVPISELGEEYFVYNETAHAVVGEHSGMSFQMGDRVEVKLIEAAPLAGALRFEMLSQGKKSSALPRSRRVGARHAHRRFPHKGPPPGRKRR